MKYSMINRCIVNDGAFVGGRFTVIVNTKEDERGYASSHFESLKINDKNPPHSLVLLHTDQYPRRHRSPLVWGGPGVDPWRLSFF